MARGHLRGRTTPALLRAVLLGSLALAFLGVSVAAVAGLLPVKEAASGRPRAIYVAMRDGTRLAVRFTLPSGWREGEKVPTVLESTRYGTKYKRSFALRVLLNLRIARERPSALREAFLQAGYGLVEVDLRGSGASFGRRDMEWSRQDIADMEQVLDWIAVQPWCSGRIAAYGISYSGNTAELSVATGHPKLATALLLYSDFDPLEGGVMPGGVRNEFLLTNWSAGNAAPDHNKKDLFNGGIAPVDEDPHEKLLREAVAGHRTIAIDAAFRQVTYFDDPLTAGYQAQSLAPYTYRTAIEQSGLPLYVRVGWQDAGTVDGALARFLTYRNRQTVVIGPWNHGGRRFYDPLLPAESGVRPGLEQAEESQAAEVVAVLDRCLKGGAEGPTAGGKEIRYYTLGEGKWKTTSTWPVSGFVPRPLYFGASGTLTPTRPAAASGQDSYQVDFTATTGAGNRWRTNLGGGPVSYPDRSEADKKLLTYTSEPLAGDLEITGVPVVTLNVASTATDGVFYAYLEDVAPDGKVTYITEGLLRALHRKMAPKEPGRAVLGPRHSHLRADGAPLKPGEVTELKIGLYATSVLVRRGHRIRIAIAGHDAANFARVPAEGTPVITVQRNAAHASYVELPVNGRV